MSHPLNNTPQHITLLRDIVVRKLNHLFTPAEYDALRRSYIEDSIPDINLRTQNVGRLISLMAPIIERVDTIDAIRQGLFRLQGVITNLRRYTPIYTIIPYDRLRQIDEELHQLYGFTFIPYNHLIRHANPATTSLSDMAFGSLSTSQARRVMRSSVAPRPRKRSHSSSS